MPAARFLAELGMSDRAQAMLFEAFARSFFARPAALSAAELIAMFHYYFLGNPEGIGFDAPDTDYLTCIWAPLRAYLERHGVQVRTGTPVRALRAARPGGGSRPTTEALDHAARRAGARSRRPPHGWSAASSGARASCARQAAACAVAPPFAVARLWLDRDVAPDRPTFNAVSREPTLDSVTVYSRLERPSAEWAARTGGSVVELHSYACTAPDAATATDRMRAELRGAVARDRRTPAWCTGRSGSRPRPRRSRPARRAPARGSPGRRPGCGSRATTSTRRSCAGSWSARPSPVCWPRTTCSAEVGARPEPVRGVPQRGLLAGWRVS